jgi:hypothetical protein
MTDPREVTAITLANQARQRCICLEDDDVTVCQCPTPITRELFARLHAYAALQPDRVVAYSELADEWITVLHAFLPPSDDPILAWLQAPFDVPPEADLQHAVDLGTLLDVLGAPPAAVLS